MGKPSKRRVGLYSRVSLEDQDPEVQLHELRQHAERRGWHVVAEYVDHGVSGAKTSRPALDSHLVLTIEELTRLGVAYCAVTQGIDTSDDNPAATLTLQVLGACSQFERAIIRSRVRAGLAKAKATGKKLGRRPKDVDQAEVRRLRAQGLSLRQVATRLGVGKNIIARVLEGSPEIPAA
jgi:DNA invertase Pin-like site-specific DNA recombinase